MVEDRVRALVAHRRQDDPAPDDPFRGLYLSDDQVDRVLAVELPSRVTEWGDDAQRRSLEEEADAFEAAGTPIRLRALARTADLSELEVDLLLLALAPDLDSRFERLYGYLNDDVTRRRATIGLGLELCGASPWLAEARGRLAAEAPLLRADLLLVEETERPYLSRSLRVPDRVAAHLLGDDRPDPAVAELLRPDVGLPTHAGVAPLAAAVSDGARLVYLRERAGSSTPALAAAALREAGRRALVIDLDHVGSAADIPAVAKLIGREALLTGAGVVAGPLEAVLERGAGAVRALADLPGPVLLHGRAGWEPSWSRRVPLAVETTAATTNERLGQWEASLGPMAPSDLAGADVTSQFLLSADQVARAAAAARLQASFTGQDVNVGHLRAGARAQNGAGLERLARRIQPGVGWDDLVLAPTTEDSLRELAARARRRDLVLDEWGMRPGGGRGRGITILFAGDSGTGKTMSAEVVAHDLGLDLYTVNLATVVDKYVGETEKNLERIFTEADGVNAVLLFDEADALFGKRSEVKDANDRYANIEVAYLLQRMETFDGLAILATNLRANVDDAFARRLDMVVDFPVPDAAQRLALWDRCLASGVPRGADLDLTFCAQAFELSGGNIRSIAITAAYLAADSGRPVSMTDLIQAIQREYRKLGRLVVASEFGSYYPLIGNEVRAGDRTV
ncbi:MAG: ATP-binding protein [Actinomycetota bacterium]|nr:ATP-binding protein [Actinomycetota bacterium]